MRSPVVMCHPINGRGGGVMDQQQNGAASRKYRKRRTQTSNAPPSPRTTSKRSSYIPTRQTDQHIQTTHTGADKYRLSPNCNLRNTHALEMSSLEDSHNVAFFNTATALTGMEEKTKPLSCYKKQPVH